MSGIAALAAAAAQQGKMVTTVAGRSGDKTEVAGVDGPAPGGQLMTSMAGGGQAIKLVQGPTGQGQVLQQGQVGHLPLRWSFNLLKRLKKTLQIS